MGTFNPELIIKHILDGVKYCHVTVALAFIPCTVAAMLGLCIALGRFLGHKGISRLGTFFMMTSKSIPSILLMFVIYYGIFAIVRPFTHLFPGVISAKSIRAFPIALFSLTITNLGFLTETMTSATRSVNKGQLEAALMSGMTNFQAIRRILLPQIMKEAVPNLCNNYTASIKLSAIAFTISVVDMLNGALIQTYKSFSYLECYLGIAILYWCLVFCVERIFQFLEHLTNKQERKTEYSWLKMRGKLT